VTTQLEFQPGLGSPLPPIQAENLDAQQTPVTSDGSFLKTKIPGYENELPRIITADCSDPKEIDDGLFVDQLDEDHELYRVGVCVADTSKLHNIPDVVAQAYERTSARYWDLPDGERGYEPMIDPSYIREYELLQGRVRDALVITFLVGAQVEPSEITISFGQVEVKSNKTYKQFAEYARYAGGKRFERASDLIKDHLGYIAYGDHSGYKPAWRTGKDEAEHTQSRSWKIGSKINEAFMVGANHLVGKTMASEGLPSIYRVHDPDDEQFLELLSSSVARYSRTPGPHAGLRLEPYCRVTSPLRRLDDFVMGNQLKQRFLGRTPTTQNAKDVALAIRLLNREVVTSTPAESNRYSKGELLGRYGGRLTLVQDDCANGHEATA
jgi:exoribonuclease R